MNQSVASSDRSSVGSRAPADVALISLTYSNSQIRVEEYLNTHPHTDILAIRDVRLYTLLHIACLNNQINICRILFSFLQRANVPQEQITEWVNTRTDEGFAAIHFASFKGNIEIIKILEHHGARLDVKNQRGLNVMHIAAQGDQPVSIAYFVRRGLDILEKDENGSSPLHWAAYFGMENATYFLTSWGCDPNEKDLEFGCTPLHLAISSGNGKVVRRLLVKGADKNIKNNEGKLPIDIARENDYEGIVDLLKNRSWIVSYLNIKPELSRKRSKASLLLFIFLTIALLGSNFLFAFPFIQNKIFFILFCVFTGIMLITFLFVWLKNPGYISDKKSNILELLISYNPHLICPDCNIVKPDRSKHCEVCNECVAVYDHHCPWINNCVGAKNYAWFVLFILSTCLTLIYLVVFSGFMIPKNEDAINYKYTVKIVQHDSVLKYTKLVVCIVNILVALIFIFPLIGLNYLHFGNLIKGKTTGERFGFRAGRETISRSNLGVESVSGDYARLTDPRDSRQPREKTETIQITEKERSCFSNCVSMCCKNAGTEKYIAHSRPQSLMNRSSRSSNKEQV